MDTWRVATAGWQSWHTALQLQTHLASVAWGAPIVVAARYAKAMQEASRPGFAFDPEWQRMVAEKLGALATAQAVWWRYGQAAAGRPVDARRLLAAGERSLRPFGRTVQGNVRRLTR